MYRMFMSSPVRDTDRNAQKFFRLLHDSEQTQNLSLVVVMHLVPGTRLFLENLARFARIAAILAKPNSQDKDERTYLNNRYLVRTLDKEEFQSSERVIQLLDELVPSGNFIIIDIGGYFAIHLAAIASTTKARLLGVVEDTENGHKRYQSLKSFPVPVISVARSELKNSEDFLVGQSIVYAAEKLMRDFGSIMNGRRATVIGYGKIGRSIALHLHSKHLTTVIVEQNPVRAIEAKAHGFHVLQKFEAISRGNLVFCATGNKCIAGDEVERLNNGSYLISVTSADDELDLTFARSSYEVTAVSDHIERFSREGHFFYVVAKGNAVNFAINDIGRLGPFIYPVQAELMVAAIFLNQQSPEISKGLIELPERLKQHIASMWEKAFATVNAP